MTNLLRIFILIGIFIPGRHRLLFYYILFLVSLIQKKNFEMKGFYIWIKMIDLYNTTLSISPASCFELQLIALFCMFLLIFSVPSNSILVIALCSKKHLKKPYNILLFSFSLICLFGSVSELPIVIISNWECGSLLF